VIPVSFHNDIYHKHLEISDFFAFPLTNYSTRMRFFPPTPCRSFWFSNLTACVRGADLRPPLHALLGVLNVINLFHMIGVIVVG
jgi:hypothetical protein